MREIEEALWAAARKVLPPALVGGPALTAAVIDRSRRYTSERERLDAPASADADLAARALFFTVADAAKPRLALTELGPRIPWDRTVRVLDLGAGAGAMSLGVLAYAAEVGAAGLEITAIDRDARALAILADALPAAARVLGVPCKVTTRTGGIDEQSESRGVGALPASPAGRGRSPLGIDEQSESRGVGALPASPAGRGRSPLGIDEQSESRGVGALPAGRGRSPLGIAAPAGGFDLVLLGSVLNELDDVEARRVAQAAVQAGDAVIIVEPALRTQARALHRLRDDAITGGWAHVFAPCTRTAAPCPMLADERDWCHEERLVELPPRVAKLAQVTGLRDGGLKFSYLVLRREPGHVGEPGAVRVVSHPLVSKGKHEAYVCGDDGRVRLRLLKRHRSDANRAFERARRGAVLRLGDAPDNDLTSGTIVERLDEPDRDH